MSRVIAYVTEEVSRQGHDVFSLDGIERVAWMLEAWSYAVEESQSGERPRMADAISMGKMLERGKVKGIRRAGVRVGSHACPDCNEIVERLHRLFAMRDSMTPLEFYREFEEIHPFVDGNGRTGKILLNWLNGTLLAPIFPPHDFWGEPIRNP